MYRNAPVTPRTFSSRLSGCRWLPLLSLAALSACQMRGNDRPLSSEAPPPPVYIDPQVALKCRAAEVRFAFGQIISAPLLEEIRLRAGARTARTALVTGPRAEGVDEGRLTVDVEPDGRVMSARCG